MDKRIRQWNKLLVMLCLCCALLGSAALAAPTGSLTVTLRNEAGTELMPGISVHLHQVAWMDSNWELHYTSAFSDVWFTTHELFHEDRVENAERLYGYVQSRGITDTVVTTGTDGKALFENLAEGAYLVHGQEGQAVTFQPFLVFMPTEIDAIDHYDVQAQPKTEDNTSPGGGGGGGTTPPGPGPNPPGPNPPGPNPPGPGTDPDPIPGGDPEPGPGTDPTPGTDPAPGKDPEPSIPQTGNNMLTVYLLLAGGVLLMVLGTADLIGRGKTDA